MNINNDSNRIPSIPGDHKLPILHRGRYRRRKSMWKGESTLSTRAKKKKKKMKPKKKAKKKKKGKNIFWNIFKIFFFLFLSQRKRLTCTTLSGPQCLAEACCCMVSPPSSPSSMAPVWDGDSLTLYKGRVTVSEGHTNRLCYILCNREQINSWNDPVLWKHFKWDEMKGEISEHNFSLIEIPITKIVFHGMQKYWLTKIRKIFVLTY